MTDLRGDHDRTLDRYVNRERPDADNNEPDRFADHVGVDTHGPQISPRRAPNAPGQRLLRVLDILMWLAVFGVFTSLAVRHDTNLLGAARFVGAFAALQAIPGAALYRVVRRSPAHLVEDAVAGAALGMVIAAGLHVLGMKVGVAHLQLAFPAVVAALLVAPSWRDRARHARVPRLPAGWWAALGVLTLLGWSALEVWMSNPVAMKGWDRFYIDVPFQLAMLSEVRGHGADQFPWVAGTPMSYGWLTYAWLAATSDGAVTENLVVLLRFLPLVMAILAPLAVAVGAMRVSGRAWAGPVATALVVIADVPALASSSQPSLSPFLILASPPFAVGVVLTCATICVVALRWRGEAHTTSTLLLAVLLLSGSLAKASVLPVIAAGAGLAAFVAVHSRFARWRVVLIDATLSLVALLVVTRLVFGGGSGGMQFAPLAGLRRGLTGELPGVTGPDDINGGLLVVIALALLVPSVGQFAGFGVILRQRFGDPLVWLIVGALFSGLLARTFLYHFGMSQNYFLLSAAPLGAMGAAWGIASVGESAAGRRVLLFGALAGGLLWLVLRKIGLALEPRGSSGQAAEWVVLLVTWLFGLVLLARRRPTFEWRVVPIGLTVGALLQGSAFVWALGVGSSPLGPGGARIHADHVKAARWLRDHSGVDDVVMTNRHCVAPAAKVCDARQFWVAGLTQRRVLVEGWGYTLQAPSGREPFWDKGLLERNDGFLRAPNEDDANWLWRRCVRWVYLDHEVRSLPDPGPTPWLEPVMRNAHVSVYRLRSASGGAVGRDGVR